MFEVRTTAEKLSGPSAESELPVADTRDGSSLLQTTDEQHTVC